MSQYLAKADPLIRARHEMTFDMLAQAGSGIVDCYLDLEAPDQIDRAAGAASALRELALNLGGNLVLESAPLALKNRLDVWGRWGPDLRLMKALKTE